MQKRTRAIAVTASMTVAGIALGATIASAANSSSTKPPALQSTGSRYVFACVNPGGGIDYLEFRAPLPHQCWFAGESLWYWDAVPLAGGGTNPTPTASTTTTSAAKLAFTTQPSSGQNIQATGTGSFNVSVAVQNSSGNTVTSGTGSSDTVTLAIGTNGGPGGVLSCTDSGGLTVTASAGVANFTGCSITTAGTGYKLTASDTTETSVTAPANANSFNITAGTAAGLSFSGVKSGSTATTITCTGTVGSTLACMLATSPPDSGTFTADVVLVDQNQNPVNASAALTISLAASAGTVDPTSLAIASGSSTTADTFTETLSSSALGTVTATEGSFTATLAP